MKTQSQEISKKFFETIPPNMHIVRKYVRRAAQDQLTVPQFRVLANLNRGLRFVGELAEHHGVSQPAMSKIVEGLVQRDLVERCTCAQDRRAIELELTTEGKTLFKQVKERASGDFMKILEHFSDDQLLQISSALDTLSDFQKKVKEVK